MVPICLFYGRCAHLSFVFQGHRLDLCCCISTSQSELDEEEPSSGFLYGVFEKYYAPALMKPPVRLIVLLVFVGWSCLSLGALSNIKVGLDQEISMPLVSDVGAHFKFKLEGRLDGI